MIPWIDCSVWTGSWPFVHLPHQQLSELKAKLSSLGGVKAYVSPLAAVFEQDPMRANHQLLTEIQDDFFSPVPVIDLSYANWRESVELSVRDGRVKAVKLLPNYHMYDLSEDTLEELVALTMRHGLRISIQMRMEDRRGQPPLFKVEDVDVFKAIKTVSYFPDQVFILHNLYVGELQQVIHSVSNVYADLSSLEKPDTLYFLSQNYPMDKLLCASHSPLFFPEGNLYKLKYSSAPQADIDRVAYQNAEKLFQQ